MTDILTAAAMPRQRFTLKPRPDETKLNECYVRKAEKRVETAESRALANPIDVESPTEALRLLEQGMRINFQQPEQLRTLIDELAKIGQDAYARGVKAPVYNLCNVALAGRNIFCEDNLGIVRSLMPQLRGKPTPGSLAAKYLTPDNKGEVDLARAFTNYLVQNRGVAVFSSVSDPGFLSATQNELNGAKVASMARNMLAGKVSAGEVWVSKDNYILDGHHRWAASIVAQLTEGELHPVNVRRVDMNILDLVEQANEFAHRMGLASMAASAARKTAFATV